MHGSGDMRYINSDWPFMVIPRYRENGISVLKIYYMINTSYYLEDILRYMYMITQDGWYYVIIQTPDTIEMLVHHVVTLLLVITSYMTQFWNSGLNVMIQMDNGDVWAGVIKGFMDITPIWFVLSVYVGLLSTWIYYRIYVFTYEVFLGHSLICRYIFEENLLHQQIMSCLLSILLMLNIYWVALLINMGLRFLKKGEAKDIQNPVEEVARNKKDN